MRYYNFKVLIAEWGTQITDCLLKLQQVMGHSDESINYLFKGLEVKQLDVEDLPEL